MMSSRFRYANKGRLDLIDKKFTRGLTLAEVKELERLQDEVEEIMDSEMPLPTARLDELEKEINKL